MQSELESEESRNHGKQPLDGLLESFAYANSDLVEASTEQLTHKQVQKARKGRRVTSNIQKKILNALRTLRKDQADEAYQVSDLFNYRP
jgi:hypothetical protein